MTDYKQLCIELVRIADALDCKTPLTSNQGQPMDDFSALAAFRNVADRTRAALAEPEPEGPTDEKLNRLFHVWWYDEGSGMTPCAHEDQEEHVHRISRIAWHNGAYCARWGNPTLQPVPVSERLPGPEDCDAEGMCWWWCSPAERWLRCGIPYPDQASQIHSHWLPAHALPVPNND